MAAQSFAVASLGRLPSLGTVLPIGGQACIDSNPSSLLGYSGMVRFLAAVCCATLIELFHDGTATAAVSDLP